ncbi:MAG: nuclear transport factor 2 family protein [Novosphingobium sp.]|nr:nuclear transport factor 2 family protein [Novosphingobium sp.]
MAFTGTLEERIAIRELHDTYADAGFRGDKRQFVDCWTDDCTWVTPFGEVNGRAALDAQWDVVTATFDQLGFFTVLGAIEVDGNTATCRAYVREIFVNSDGAIQKIVGRYDDTLAKQDGAWKFASRIYSILIHEGGE